MVIKKLINGYICIHKSLNSDQNKIHMRLKKNVKTQEYFCKKGFIMANLLCGGMLLSTGCSTGSKLFLDKTKNRYLLEDRRANTIRRDDPLLGEARTKLNEIRDLVERSQAASERVSAAFREAKVAKDSVVKIVIGETEGNVEDKIAAVDMAVEASKRAAQNVDAAIDEASGYLNNIRRLVGSIQEIRNNFVARNNRGVLATIESLIANAVMEELHVSSMFEIEKNLALTVRNVAEYTATLAIKYKTQ